MILLLSLFINTSCSDNDDSQIENIQIIHAEIPGMYEVVNSQSSTEFDGDVWDIRVKNINIACTYLKPYTFEKETLKVGDRSYTFIKIEEGFTITNSDNKTFTLIKTNKSCDDEEEPAYLNIEDIIGHYKIVEAYSYKSGSNPTSNTQLVGQIWDITEEYININCSLKTTSYTFDKNILIAGDIEYQIEKSDSKESKIVISYILDNVIYDLYLEETTKICPEEDKPQFGDVELDKMYGYAAYGGTTGGEGALKENIHHFDNGYKFTAWLKAREKSKSVVPAIVWLSGEFVNGQGRDKSTPWFDIKDTENLTIYGTNNFKMKNIGFFIVRSENIIIRNVYIEMPKADNGADGISMQKSKRVWVDHCTFESMNQTKDYEDGSVDITHQTKEVTVSWNHFIKTQKSALVGHSNNEINDKEITATFHHNFFDGSNSRHPRVRFGKVHVYNNYFNKVTTYAIGSAYGAKVLVEDNFFDGVRLPTDICTYPAKKSGNSWVSNLQGSEAGFLYANSGNFYQNIPEDASNPYPFTNLEYKAYEGEKLLATLTYEDFKPEYEYVVNKGESVSEVVRSGAGVGKLPNFEKAPLEVDNGGVIDTDPDEPENPDEPQKTEILAEGWYAKNIGDNKVKGTLIVDDNGKLTITSAGKFEGSGQSFYYVYREVEGAFVATLRIDEYKSIKSNNQGMGGLLFTPDITTEGKDFIHALSGKSGKEGDEYNYSHRLETNTNSKRGSLKNISEIGGDSYVKLERKGNAYYASYSTDGGQTYGNVQTDNFVDLPAKLYIGIALNSSNNDNATYGTFSDFRINGKNINFVD